MKHVHVVGDKGNMGKRYTAILNHLRISNSGSDVGEPITTLADLYIVASPTSTHLELMSNILNSTPHAKILCEKPFTKEIELLRSFQEDYKKSLHRIAMVNQYKYLPRDIGVRPYITIYDYFKHGADGKAYDCINIIGMSESHVYLEETSPVWTCWINGGRCAIEDMDEAYMKMINDWTTNQHGNWDYAFKAHEKVEQWLKSH